MAPKVSSIVRPRVNVSLLNKYVDKYVTVLGTVESIDGSNSKIIVSDGAIECISTSVIQEFAIGDAYEITGKVLPDHTVKIYRADHMPKALPADLEGRLLRLREGAAKELFFRASKTEVN